MGSIPPSESHSLSNDRFLMKALSDDWNHQEDEELAVAVGKTEELMRSGSTTSRAIREAEQRAALTCQSGTPAQYRRTCAMVARKFAEHQTVQSLLKEVGSVLPSSVVPEYQTSTVQSELADIHVLFNEALWQGEISAFAPDRILSVQPIVIRTAQEFHAALENVSLPDEVRSASQIVSDLLVSTRVFIFNALFKTISSSMPVSAGSDPSRENIYGLPVAVSHLLSNSVLSAYVRTLLHNGKYPKLRDALLEERKFRNMYKLPPEIAVSVTLHIESHQQVINALIAAIAHEHLGELIETLRAFIAAHPKQPAIPLPLPNGVRTVQFIGSWGSLGYMRHATDRVVEESFDLSNERLPATDTSRQAGLWRMGNTFFTHPDVLYAGVEFERWPEGASLAADAMHIARNELANFYQEQPRMAAAASAISYLTLGRVENDSAWLLHCTQKDYDHIKELLIGGITCFPTGGGISADAMPMVALEVNRYPKTSPPEQQGTLPSGITRASLYSVIRSSRSRGQMQWRELERLLRAIGMTIDTSRGDGSHLLVQNPETNHSTAVSQRYAGKKTGTIPISVVLETVCALHITRAQFEQLSLELEKL